MAVQAIVNHKVEFVPPADYDEILREESRFPIIYDSKIAQECKNSLSDEISTFDSNFPQMILGELDLLLKNVNKDPLRCAAVSPDIKDYTGVVVSILIEDYKNGVCCIENLKRASNIFEGIHFLNEKIYQHNRNDEKNKLPYIEIKPEWEEFDSAFSNFLK